MKKMKFNGEFIEKGKLPIPAGYRILVGRLKVDDTSQGGIIMTSEYNRAKENNTSLAKVLAVGNLAFKSNTFKETDHENAPPVPWCKVGDIILVSRYTGLDVEVTDGEEVETLKILNDDECLGLVSDINTLAV